MSGLLVVFEGGEGVGKTTQWNLLARRLSSMGHSVKAFREPGGTRVGDSIRAMLLDPECPMEPTTEALLFAASRAELVATEIRPALEKGSVVLLDRHLLSTYVYQGRARGIGNEVLSAINSFATGGLTPDCTILLSLPLEKALRRVRERGAPDRLDSESDIFHSSVHAGFEEALSEEWQKLHPECGGITSVDADGTIEEVAERCFAVLARMWPSYFPDVPAP